MVNGASFNYGNFKRHWQLDVEPVQPHDPDFRNRMTKGLSFTQQIEKRWGQQAPEQFDKSFYNPKGIYAQSHRSLANDVKRQARLFSLWFMALNRIRTSNQRRFICLNNHKTIREQQF